MLEWWSEGSCNIYPSRQYSHRVALFLLYIKRFICGVFGEGERVQRAFYLIFDKVYCGWRSIVSAELCESQRRHCRLYSGGEMSQTGREGTDSAWHPRFITHSQAPRQGLGAARWPHLKNGLQRHLSGSWPGTFASSSRKPVINWLIYMLNDFCCLGLILPKFCYSLHM